MSERPLAIVLRTAGTNCDAELCRAFELAGATPRLVHVDRLIAEPGVLDRAHIIAVPGGFSYGDDIAAGRVLATRLRTTLYPALRDAVSRGVPIIGVCNGFQVLVQSGLLPGPTSGETWPESPAPASIALAANKDPCFIDRWCRVTVDPSSPCVWTRGIADASPDTLMLPIAHGEGRVVVSDDATLEELRANHQIPMRYAEGENPNGSADGIVGVCDASGLVFGLMPHPERYLAWSHHPFWTQLPAGVRAGETPGLTMFRGAVESLGIGA
ncbi:MAG: phosphoribosylformylglycinamidine synthase subunit PurQ [Planctomycetota bacterium]